MQHNASNHSTLQSPEVGSMSTRAHGDHTLRGISKEDGSKVDNQLAHAAVVIQKAHRLQVEATCALSTSKSSFTLSVIREGLCYYCMWHTHDARRMTLVGICICSRPSRILWKQTKCLSLAASCGHQAGHPGRPAQPGGKRCKWKHAQILAYDKNNTCANGIMLEPD